MSEVMDDESKNGEQRAADWWRFEVTPSVIIATIGLLVSLVVAGYNFYQFIRGPDVEFYLPKLVSFRCSEVITSDNVRACAEDGYVTMTATSMTYLNKASSEYSAVLFDEVAEIRSGDDSWRLDWLYISDITQADNSSTNVSAELIPGAGALVHETQFFPLARPCIAPCEVNADVLRWNDFVARLGAGDEFDISFTTTIRRPEIATLAGVCRVYVDARLRAAVSDPSEGRTRISSVICTDIGRETNA